MTPPPNIFLDPDRLHQIRLNADWKLAFVALGLIKDERKSKADDWWAWSPFTDENTPSFHINAKGFYCHSTHQGGGIIELVQKVIGHRTGQNIDCYEAARWLVQHHVSHIYENKQVLVADPKPTVLSGERKKMQAKSINQPICQNLAPLLTEQGSHPEFVRRGISQATCQYLTAGYLPETGRGKAIEDRIVFQVRGICELTGGEFCPVLLTHIGRAVSPEKIASEGKWRTYTGFKKTLELYNLDNVLLDKNAIEQVKATGQIVIVEGCFDVAKLVEAGIYNVVASFGAHLAATQLPRLQLLANRLGVTSFLIWYDRDQAGLAGMKKAVSLITESGFSANSFNWNLNFESANRRLVCLPADLTDACDFSVRQLKWLRGQRLI